MPTHIALAGATGNLGQPILKHLLDKNFTVTVLSRINGTSSKLTPHPNLTIKQVDFTSVQSLTAALKDPTPPQVLISCLATLAIGSQNPLIDAAVTAGVQRFIPAEFGMDSTNPLARALPVCAPKAVTQEYLAEKAGSNAGFSWTGIANGLFLDWCLDAGIILDFRTRCATLYNGGDVKFSATLLSDVARAVVGVIGHLVETKNRVVYVQSATVTQNQLLGYAKERDGKDWHVTVKGTEEVRQESLEKLAKGEQVDIDGAMLGFCIVGSWDPEYGCDFSRHLDNELLGVRELTEAELSGVVGGYM
ncbi:hypothetical protein BDV19DRAFT_397527 [Aspergillus venezuelensis]